MMGSVDPAGAGALLLPGRPTGSGRRVARRIYVGVLILAGLVVAGTIVELAARSQRE
jgi:hypothetical protein